MIGSNETVLQLAKDLDLAGYWVPAIRPPTVPVGMSRLRMTLSAAHTHDDISALANILLHLELLN
jgi:8-amino-7-oxononanoate synthase